MENERRKRMLRKIVTSPRLLMMPRDCSPEAEAFFAEIDALTAEKKDATKSQSVTEGMVREALHLCPSELDFPGRTRWIAKYISAVFSFEQKKLT